MPDNKKNNSSKEIKEKQALDYHSKGGRQGKIEVISTKPCSSQRDLSLAYTPGVAVPCLKIKENPHDAYKYTAKGNLVAVITNGSAVLGLGNIGPLAGKPVMEGKAILFKKFADIDVFDIELDIDDPDKFIETVKYLEPTFGGINLEDIKAPECFYIEQKLKKETSIPIFHDDQHGTAIISGAALINALEIANKKIQDVKIVISGAGAAGVACTKLYVSLGANPKNIIMCDSKGVLYKGRSNMNAIKEQFAQNTNARTLADAMKNADVFSGLSAGGIVTKDMVKSMNHNPIIFAMSNPNPEITYPDATSVRNDLIMATGRSDYPNQVNNVLGFPFIFRGALDTEASAINEEMKIAAVKALAKLAKELVLDSVLSAYNLEELEFGRDYVIPKPFDPRVLLYVAPAVAKAAMETGVARKPIKNFEEYILELEKIHGTREFVVRQIINRVKTKKHSIVLPEGTAGRVIKASHIIADEHIATPILLGDKKIIEKKARMHGISLKGIEIIDPITSTKKEQYAQRLYQLRQRKGVIIPTARELISKNMYFSMMMVEENDADGVIAGVRNHYSYTIKPALEIIKLREGLSCVSSFYLVMFKTQTIIFADTTVNIDPNAEQLAEIALGCTEAAKSLGIEPRVAMLSFSNFGSVINPSTSKVAKAVSIIRQKKPNLRIDGEMQADTALSPYIINKYFPFSRIKGRANVLIFPELNSANISYKLTKQLANAELIGPVLMGLQKPVNILEKGCSVESIVNMAAITALEIDKGTF